MPGFANIDHTVVDAARSMGMSETRVLLRVEVPNALPLIVGGLRLATLQLVSTATVAAYASLGGLGRYLIDGIKVRQFHIAVVGALMVAALALILDAAWALLVWASVPGTGRLHRKPPNDDATQRTPDKSSATEQAAKPPESSPTVCM